MTASWDGLADALQAAPDLTGAACAGRWNLFDPPDSDAHETPEDTRYRHRAAKEICDRCPVFDACSVWVAGLVPGEVSGVVAGIIHKPPTKTVVPKHRRRAA
ncbi:MAG: WhiB family transcriptional regulator [Rhodococcus sp. (in: high G+C Gram-positive bacteria)]